MKDHQEVNMVLWIICFGTSFQPVFPSQEDRDLGVSLRVRGEKGFQWLLQAHLNEVEGEYKEKLHVEVKAREKTARVSLICGLDLILAIHDMLRLQYQNVVNLSLLFSFSAPAIMGMWRKVVCCWQANFILFFWHHLYMNLNARNLDSAISWFWWVKFIWTGSCWDKREIREDPYGSEHWCFQMC
jgi:hypothetical protein